MTALRSLFRVAGPLLFWGWNLWFIVWLWLGLGATVLGQVLVAVWVGLVPLQFGLFLLALLATPVIGVIAGLHPRLRGDPGRLLSVFYGVQVPLMALLAIRLFAIHQLGAATTLALATGLVGAGALARVLFAGPREPTVGRQGLLLIGASADLLAGWWLAAGLAVLGAPLPFLFLRAVVRDPPGSLGNVLGMGLVGLTVAVLGTFPLARIGVATRVFELTWRATAERVGKRRATAVSVGTLVALLSAFALSGRQPHTSAFTALEAADTDAERAALVERSEAVRRGLVYARLAPDRTFDGTTADQVVTELYGELFGGEPKLPAAVWRGVLWPFVYRPVHPDEDPHAWESAEVEEATQAYADFFDAPIEIAEREALVAAARSTWDWEEAHAGLIDAGAQEVHLAEQHVTVEPRGDVARVSVHEVYRNRTWDRQEVTVHFSLPESAAITGLWLGTSADRSRAFPFVVAPRGAAQEVYESEVRVRRDPALLEQVGPRQYRLRAFPVEPRVGEMDDPWSIRSEGPELHVWMDLVTPVGAEHPLPVESEVRNLFWDDASVRTLDGAPFTSDRWMPEAALAGSAIPHHVAIAGYTVHAEPVGAVRPGPAGPVVVFVDGTRSMELHRDEVDRALARLRSVADVTVWCVREQAVQRCDDFDASTALWWGATPLEVRLAALPPLDAERLVVLTDAGSYSLASAADELPDRALPPLWLVHFGGLPGAYTDWLLDRIGRTGGGIAADVDELLVRWSDPDVHDGYRWTVTEGAGEGGPDPFAPMAARALVYALDRRAASDDPARLDALHAVAVQQAVVTPWSSMLVLVDEAQRERLAAAEARADRFDREVIDAPEPPPMSAVPEPGPLVLLAAALAGWAARRWRQSSAG